MTGLDTDGAAALAADLQPRHGLVLVGPAGIGKTTLARAIVDVLAATHHVQRVRGSRSALDVPLGAYEAVLPPGVQQARAAIAYIRDEAERDEKPALLVVDDAHDLDDASAFVTLALAESDDISLLCCRRSGENAPAAIDALVRDRLVREYEVKPLDTAGVADLARAHLGGPLGPATTARLTQLSGGNPMLVNELIDAGQRSQTLVEQVGTWHWIGDWQSSVRLNNLVEERLDALDEPARELLELIALAEPVTLAALRTACDAARPGGSFLDDIARLERVELAEIDTMNGDLHVAHPLYGEVLRASLPQARLHHHARVLAHLPDDGRPEREVRAVRWKIDAGMDVPAPVLLHAATVAHEREDLRNASMLARRAKEAGELVRSGRLLGLIYEQLGDVAAATEALNVAAEAATEPDDIFLVAMSRAELAFAHQDDPQASFALLDEVETRVPGAAEWLLPPRAMQTMLLGEPMKALAMAEPLVAREGEMLALFGVVCTLGLALTGRANEAVAVARRAIAARADLDAQTVARHALFATALVFALVETGGLSEARAIAQEGLQDAQRTGAMQAEGWFALARATIELAGSRTVDAGAWFAESAARFSPFASPVERWASSGAALAAAMRGDTEQARSLLDHTDAFGPTCWRFLDPLIARARGWTAAAADDFETAVKVFEDAAGHAHAHHLFSLEAVLATDLVRVGAPELGRQRLEALVPVMDNPRVAHWAAYASALATSDAEGLERAARSMNGEGAVAEAADAYAQAAALLWQNDKKVDATEAAAMARAHAARAQDISTPALRALDTVPPLTDRQVEIAQMAADGMPSREIAKRLVVSVRTVDNHLARIFRTFDISTRAELGEILAAWRPAPTESSALSGITG